MNWNNVFFFVSFVKIAMSYNLDLHKYMCNIGDVVQNDCTVCICNDSGFFECSSNQCSDRDLVWFRDRISDKHKKPQCQSNMVYVQDDISCLCTNNGKWPHKDCEALLQSLPPNLRKYQCEPNSYLIIDCNVCRCNAKGKIDKNHCTKNKCRGKNRSQTRRSNRENKMYGSCKANNWYSMAPCQFCYCVNDNTLICNTGRHYIKKLEVGAYNLSICGKNLIKEASDLIPRENNYRVEKLNEVQLTHGEDKTKKLASNHYDKSKSQLNDQLDVKYPKVGQFNDEVEVRYPKDESSEYYALSEQLSIKTTQNPFQEGDELYSIDSKEMKINGRVEEPGIQDSENHSGSVIKEFKEEKTSSKSQSLDDIEKEQSQRFISDLIKLEESLKTDFPGILDKVFKMAVRKSMVTVEKNKGCTVGSIEVKKCNTCYCLKSGKMLCTKNACK